MSLQNREDLRALDEVLEFKVSETQREAFVEMQASLQSNERLTMSAKQRSWVKAVIDEHKPQYENLYSSGKAPRGKEVPTPPSLMNLPKRPPHRRHEVGE